jgi:hypothetical protein
MSESIPPILPTQIVSNYTRTAYVGDDLVTTHVEHQVVNGAIRVAEVGYTLYNGMGQLVDSPKPQGTNVSIDV